MKVFWPEISDPKGWAPERLKSRSAKSNGMQFPLPNHPYSNLPSQKPTNHALFSLVSLSRTYPGLRLQQKSQRLHFNLYADGQQLQCGKNNCPQPGRKHAHWWNRCPKGVNCVQEGEAQVTLSVNGQPQRVTIDVNDKTTARLGIPGGSVEVLSLDPYPQAEVRVKPEDRRLRIRMVKSADM